MLLHLCCFRVDLVIVDLFKLMQAIFDLLQVPFSLKVIRQFELELYYAFLLLFLNCQYWQLEWLFNQFFFLLFWEIAEIRSVPIYLLHDVCAVAYELDIEVHQFFLVLLGHLFSMHQFSLLEVLLAHFLCINVLWFQLIVLLLCGDILLIALFSLFLLYDLWIFVSDQYILFLLVFFDQGLQPPLLRLQQFPLLVRLLLLQHFDLACFAGLILDAHILCPQLLFLSLLPLKLVFYFSYHLFLYFPQLMHPLLISTIYLLQLPLNFSSSLGSFMLNICQFDAVVILYLYLMGQFLPQYLDGMFTIDHKSLIVLATREGMLFVDVIIAGDVGEQPIGDLLLGLFELIK